MSDTDSIPQDDFFVVHVNESMELRNQLRSGLVEAQQKDTARMPLMVSWPKWLEDGIVCLYLSDFKDIIGRVVNGTAQAVLNGEDGSDVGFSAAAPEVPAGDFQTLDVAGLDHVDQPAPPKQAPKPTPKASGPAQSGTGLENSDIPEGLL